MNVSDAAKKSGLTRQAIYKQIKNKKAYGRYFKINAAGKQDIDARIIIKAK